MISPRGDSISTKATQKFTKTAPLISFISFQLPQFLWIFGWCDFPKYFLKKTDFSTGYLTSNCLLQIVWCGHNGKHYIFWLLICFRRDLRQLVGVLLHNWKWLKGSFRTSYIKIHNFFFLKNFFYILNFDIGPSFVDDFFQKMTSKQ